MHSHLVAVATACLAAALSAQNQALQFTTGVFGAVEVPYDPALVPPTGLTVEAWITFDDSTIPTGGTNQWPTIARQNITPQAESWNLRIGSGNLGNRNVEFGIRNTANGYTILSAPFQPGEFLQWTHLAATFDGQTMMLYKNGVQITSRPIALTEIRDSGGMLRIGNGDSSLGGNETWNGLIDELRIWPMPRSAGEILAAMNQELMSMPGKVVTFNFNGNYVDTSTGLIGTPTGTVAFVPGPTPLPMVMPVALNVGAATTTCARTIDTAIGSVPMIGNTAFTVWCTKGPRGASSPLGLVVAAGLVAPGNQPPLLGVTLAFDLASVLSTVAFVPGSSPIGNQSVTLGIPNRPVLIGTNLVFQFAFSDAACGPQGFSASNGIAFTIL